MGVIVGQFNELGIPEGARVLDAGCGIGRHSIELAKRGYEVVGFDISPLYLEEARRAADAAGVTVRLVKGDMRDVGHALGEEKPFQAVVNMFTSHGYYRKDDRLEILSRDCADYVRPRGGVGDRDVEPGLHLTKLRRRWGW